MAILALDTSSGSTGIIIKKSDKSISLCATFRYRENESIITWLSKMLEELNIKLSHIELIICTLGPGSFTGLRLGLSIGKGLSFGIGCPLVGVPSLDVFAEKYSFFYGVVLPIIDAKKGRFYCALYRNGERITNYKDLLPDDILELLKGLDSILITGPAANQFRDIINSKNYNPDNLGKLFFTNSNHEPDTLIELGKKILITQGPLAPGHGPIYIR